MAKSDDSPTLGDLVKAGSPSLLRKVSPQEKKRLFSTPVGPLLQEQISIRSESHYSGPIPPPEMLAHYEAISPGLANRIIAMAEQQAAHRQSLESHAVPEQLLQSKRGQIFGFCIGLLAIVCAAFVGIYGDPKVGIAIAVSGLGTLATSFVLGQARQKRELEKKS